VIGLSPSGFYGIKSHRFYEDFMPIPETTSAEAFERYVGGKCLRAGHGKAWREIKAWIVAPPSSVDALHLPSVSEPFLAWTISGEVEFQER
jgi:hypothetical protein